MITAHSTWKFKSNDVRLAGRTRWPCIAAVRMAWRSELRACSRRRTSSSTVSGQVACFIAESIQGVGGTVVPPPEYFAIVYDIVRKAGGGRPMKSICRATGRALWVLS